MLSKNQEKLIQLLHRKKGRKESGLCLVEGKKVIEEAREYIDFTFSCEDSDKFDQLVTTETPQDMAAVARIPVWKEQDVLSKKTIVVLDGVQDPGNVGTILRLCLAFDASLLFVESADPTSPKVVRSSVGALFHVPWLIIPRTGVENVIDSFSRPVYKLEKRDHATSLDIFNEHEPRVLIAGSEGKGIQIDVKSSSLFIPHSEKLESLNVASALSIALYTLK